MPKYKVKIVDILRLKGVKLVEVEAPNASTAEKCAYDMAVSGEIDFEPRETLDNETTTGEPELIS